MRVCEAAKQVMIERGAKILIWGDLDMLHAISDLCNSKSGHPLDVCQRVINALSKQPGELQKGYIQGHDSRCRSREVLCFKLPDAVNKKEIENIAL